MELRIDSTNSLNKQLSSGVLYSFDVFDTLITRSVASPIGIFSIMQHKLSSDGGFAAIPELLRQNFCTIRSNTESYIRANRKYLYEAQDITFEDIYRLIQVNYNLTDKITKFLMDLEIQTEIANIYPIQKNILLLKDCLNAGNRVVLISDMYHSADTIRMLLMSVDQIFLNIPIYVSSEFNRTKGSGDLYDYIKEKENISFSNWIHYGDNIRSDINMAKKKGIKAIHTPQQILMPYEHRLLYNSKNDETDIYSQVTAGCAKMARTLNNSTAEAYKFGCSFAAPILYNYVSWVLDQAISRGIKRLHFLSRDGYVLKLIAEQIVKAKNLDINLNYLYGSRKAWRIPTEKTVDDYLEYMFGEYLGFMTPEFISGRLQLPINLIETYYGTSLPKRLLNKDEVEDLKLSLKNNVAFRKDIIAKYTKESTLLKKYLLQEFESSTHPAIVDLHGTGRTQDLITKLLPNTECVYSFYFHMTPKTPNNLKNIKLSYFSTNIYNHYIVELLCRNLDGQTIGYEKQGGKIIPVTEDVNSENLIRWGYDSYLQGLIDYTENMLQFEKRNNLSVSNYKIYITYLDYILYRLDKKTADVIGDIPYLLTGDETKVNACARKYNWKDYFKMLIWGNVEYNVPLSYISRARSNVKFKRLFERNKVYKNLFGYITKNILSVENSKDKRYKIITVCFAKFKFRRKHNG